uniref:Putative secreted protein n=1 Tax=Anopheles darlingi TaxID=43151 RepID=A0A2M4DIM5_ANODA
MQPPLLFEFELLTTTVAAAAAVVASPTPRRPSSEAFPFAPLTRSLVYRWVRLEGVFISGRIVLGVIG